MTRDEDPDERADSGADVGEGDGGSSRDGGEPSADEFDWADEPESTDDTNDDEGVPNYTWRGGEPEWRDGDEPDDRTRRSEGRGRRPASDRPDAGRRDRPHDSVDDPPRGAPRRDAPDPERRRPGDGRPRDERPREGQPRDVRAARSPRHGGPRNTVDDGTRTRDGIGWNFDEPHRDRRASRDERRGREPARRRERRRDTDGPKRIDFDRKGSFSFAFSYPLQRGWGPVLTAGAVVLGSALLLFLPLVFVFGYVFRLTRYAAQGRPQPPFENYGEMLTDGVGYVVVFALAATAWLVATVVGTELHEAVGLTFALVGVYLFPAVLTVYPVTGSIAKTFTSTLPFDVAFTRHYVKHYLIYVVLLVALRVVSSFSLLLLIIGIAWGWAFTYLANGAYWGFVYYKGTRTGVFPPADEVDQRRGY